MCMFVYVYMLMSARINLKPTYYSLVIVHYGAAQMCQFDLVVLQFLQFFSISFATFHETYATF